MKAGIKVIVILLSLFIVSQLLGIIVLQRNVDAEESQREGKTVFQNINIAGVEIEKPEVQESWSFAYIVIAVILGTLLIFAIARLKLLVLWKLWFFLAASFCMVIALNSFIPGVVAIVLGAGLAFYKVFKPNVIIHNITEPFVYAGISVIFVPLINIFSVIILLLLISAYDAYAVWKSKHMIKLAKMQTKAGLFSGMMIPYRLKGIKPGKPGNIKKGKKARLAKRTAKMPVRLKQNGIRVAVLGGGDMAFPLLFAGVVFKTYGFWPALLIIPFTALALFLLFYKGRKDKFYPAMPFLTAGCIAGLLLLVLIRILI